MGIGQKVKVKGIEAVGTIVCVYAVPKDWDLVDIQFDNGDVMHGVSTEIVTLVDD